MKPLYANDWHQCHRCSCTFPDATLRKLQLVDDVLKLTSDVYQCVDEPRCAIFKQHRADALARENNLGLTPVAVRRRR